MKTGLNIRDFTDYRAFLAAHFQDLKRANPGYSYGRWAQKIGLKDTSSITKIIKGDREPGDQITNLVVKYFKFPDREAEYFRDLIRLSKIRRDPALKVLLLEKMARQNPSQTHRLLDEKTFSVISNWFCLPIREMTKLADFEESAEWIAQKLRFKVNARELKQALQNLIELGLLARDEQGRLQVADKQVTTSNDVQSEAIRRYHEQMLENAKHAVRSVDIAERELQAESLVMEFEDLEQAKAMIREFREKFSNSFERSQGDAVYQFQIQLFPLTKIKGDSK